MITKIYFGEYVYLYHHDLNIQKLRMFIESYITKKTNYLIKWKDLDEMICIVREEDLIESIEESNKLKQQYHKIYLNILEIDNQQRLSLSSVITKQSSIITFGVKHKKSQEDGNISFMNSQYLDNQPSGSSQKQSNFSLKKTTSELRTPGFKDQFQSSFQSIPSFNNFQGQGTFQQLTDQKESVFPFAKSQTSLELELDPDLSFLVDNKFQYYYQIPEEIDEDQEELQYSELLEVEQHVISQHNNNNQDIFFPVSQSFDMNQDEEIKESIDLGASLSEPQKKMLPFQSIDQERQNDVINSLDLPNPPSIKNKSHHQSRDDSSPIVGSQLSDEEVNQNQPRKNSKNQLKLVVKQSSEMSPQLHTDMENCIEEKLDTVYNMPPSFYRHSSKIGISDRKSMSEQFSRPMNSSSSPSPQKMIPLMKALSSQQYQLNPMKASMIMGKSQMTQSAEQNQYIQEEPGFFIFCDFCSQQIDSHFYRCNQCDDFDLCEICYEPLKHPQHAMDIIQVIMVQDEEISLLNQTNLTKIDSAHLDEEQCKSDPKVLDEDKTQSIKKKLSQNSDDSQFHQPLFMQQTESQRAPLQYSTSHSDRQESQYESFGDLPMTNLILRQN